MSQSSSSENTDLKENLDKFFAIEDLSELEQFYQGIESKYGLEKIQNFLNDQGLPKTEQGRANLAFYPELLDPKARIEFQKEAIVNSFRDYVFLATVVGLQEIKMLNNDDYSFFVNEMGRYLDFIRDQGLKAPFYQVVAKRIAVTLFSFPSIITFNGIHKVIVPILKDSGFEPMHHNLLLLLAKHESDDFLSENDPISAEAKELRKLINSKEEDLSKDQKLKIKIYYPPIPSLKMLSS